MISRTEWLVNAETYLSVLIVSTLSSTPAISFLSFLVLRLLFFAALALLQLKLRTQEPLLAFDYSQGP